MGTATTRRLGAVAVMDLLLGAVAYLCDAQLCDGFVDAGTGIEAEQCQVIDVARARKFGLGDKYVVRLLVADAFKHECIP